MYMAHQSLALGASVPTEHGTFTATTAPPYCGSPFAMQQMLRDLGFYGGPINGKVDGPTLQAASDFARSKGVSNQRSVTAELCRLLGSEWTKLSASKAGVARPVIPMRARPSTSELDVDSYDLGPPELDADNYPLAPATGWAGLDQTTKYAIGAAVALGLGGIVVLAVVGKKRKKKK